MSLELEREYLDIVSSLNGDEIGRRKAWKRMEAGFAKTRRGTDPISYIPTIFDESELNFFLECSSTIYSIMKKVLIAYRDDEKFRKLYHLDPRIEELLLIDTFSSELLPVCRLDAIYDERRKALNFLEFNTDASGGMAESVESYSAISLSDSFKEFSKRHKVRQYPDNLYLSLVRNFGKIYQKSGKTVENPHVAIAVLFDSPNAIVSELEEYIKYFEAENMEASIFDVRELWCEDGVLVGHKAIKGKSNVKVDAIWRFCIVVDLIEHWDEVKGFINALKDRKAVMIGSFLTQAVHDKQLFALLRKKEVIELFDEKEKTFISSHIPFTAFLDEMDTALLQEKDRWILKPTDWYGSQKVYAGSELSEVEWEERLEECRKESGHWLCQEKVSACNSLALPLHGDEKEYTSDFISVGNILGMYIYSGVFSGIYMRQGTSAIIGTARGEMASPVIWVSND
ncbi:MAG: hypothetical protein K6G51_02505 [Sphaerochaetaceae bacterium]|nr:hypothetical protein [Sphaerochaetaceae bacterium]